MTHREIMQAIQSNPTIGDYISLAVAYGWKREKILRNLYDHIMNCTGQNEWDAIEALYVLYMETHAVGAPEPKERRVGPVEYKGGIYKTVREASRVHGVSHTAIKNAIKRGEARYV